MKNELLYKGQKYGNKILHFKNIHSYISTYLLLKLHYMLYLNTGNIQFMQIINELININYYPKELQLLFWDYV